MDSYQNGRVRPFTSRVSHLQLGREPPAIRYRFARKAILKPVEETHKEIGRLDALAREKGK